MFAFIILAIIDIIILMQTGQGKKAPVEDVEEVDCFRNHGLWMDSKAVGLHEEEW
jgi:hypothetical protein